MYYSWSKYQLEIQFLTNVSPSSINNKKKMGFGYSQIKSGVRTDTMLAKIQITSKCIEFSGTYIQNTVWFQCMYIPLACCCSHIAEKFKTDLAFFICYNNKWRYFIMKNTFPMRHYHFSRHEFRSNNRTVTSVSNRCRDKKERLVTQSFQIVVQKRGDCNPLFSLCGILPLLQTNVLYHKFK